MLTSSAIVDGQLSLAPTLVSLSVLWSVSFVFGLLALHHMQLAQEVQ